jgi:putative two-component system response regulator
VGSVEFMSPEQSRDPSSVAAPADIYGLGATLFWLLTGDLPHATRPTLVAALKALQEEPPRKLRVLRGDAPAELEQLLDQLLDRDPANRPPTPLAVMRALSRFTSTGAAAYEIDLGEGAGSFPVPDSHNDGDAPADRPRRVLIAHEDEDFCHRAAHLLRDLNCTCDSTGEGGLALETMCGDQYDLAIIDRKLSDMDGAEAIRRLRQHPYSPNLRILALVDADPPDALADALGRGADDALPRQFTPKQLTAKVQHALQTKAALDRYEQMARQLSQTIQQLDNSLRSRSHDVRQAQNALLFAMARIAESREGETPGHLRRMQRFARCLAEQAAGDAAWADLVSEEFLEELERCVPLHDIGKIGLPDALLLKPGELTPAERATMETHTVMGSSILESLGREHGGALTFLGMAHAIVRHHHERYDGQGYPDRLSGIDIPPAARLVAVADVYDALRRQRSHRPALSHAEAVRCITEQSPGQFDPVLLQTFAACHPRFERIFREIHE